MCGIYFPFKLSTLIFLVFVALPWSTCVYADEASSMANAQVIQSFSSHDNDKPGVLSIQDKKKRLIMFVLGVPLLIMILITAILGVAMGVYGKQVFVAHMIFAGLSVTLAIAHAIVGLVWFFPF